MRYPRLLLLVAASAASLGAAASAQEPAKSGEPRILFGADLDEQLRERQERIARLPADEREKMQTAQKKGLEDPDVKAALKKREEAVRVYRQALRKSMLEADPAIAEIFEKLREMEATKPTRGSSRPAKR